ncbi:TPA: hypothetical protein ACGORW_000761 [Streptococcus suis]|nr:hypothetical protein [Streptococcus suis]MBY5039511.1 hypothetical protein [Streptococcus suis]MDW8682281.1 hypothetical protein [Streptococcus suis]NQN53273.1 hypothetical protein [Streptococcus suis]HEM3684405.1 hypothetical protein [Streptococcus suis]
MEWTEESLQPIIHSILNPGEEVLYTYQSVTTQSIYVCILLNDYYYKVFRVSNHPSKSTYKQPTFYDFHGEFYMKGAIRKFLYQDGSWYELSKQRYYILKFLQRVWEENKTIFASWQKEKFEVRLLMEEEDDCLVQYRFPDNQAREVERLLASGLLTSIRLSKSTLKIRVSRFVLPLLEMVEKRQLYRKKPSKSMLQWERYKSQLIELQRTYRVVEDGRAKTFWGRIELGLEKYLTSGLIYYWQRVLTGVEWQEEKKEVEKVVVKSSDPIEDKWRKNIAKRHKRKVGQLVEKETLEKLEQLKSELDK